MKITDIIFESSNKVKWEYYPLDKDTITGWGKSFPKDKPKEVNESGIYNPNGKTFRGSGNPMPQFDPNDAMMQGDYDQLNTVTATDQGGIDKVESDIDRNRLKDIIRSGMKILTSEEREVLNLRYWHDLDHNKVGKKIGLNTEKVWKIEAKALRKLRDQSNAPEIRRYMDPTFKPKPAPMAIGNVVKSLSTSNGPKVGSYYEMGFKDAINGTKSMTRHNAMSSDETWDQRSQYDAGYESGKRKIKSSKVRESLSPFNDDHSELDQYVKEEFNREIDEVKFDPSRRGFLKKAGAVAASAAMPKGLAASAMKAVTPAAAVMSKAVSTASDDVFAGLAKIDFDDMLALLDSAEAKNMIKGADPYDLDIIRDIAKDAAENEWGNSWFINGNSAQSLVNMIDKCKEWQKQTKISDDDIIKNIRHIVQDRFEKAPGEEDGRFRSANNTKNPEFSADDLEKVTIKPKASASTGMSSLARAAGAQIGRTMKNVGKATANTILNQPAKDMGKIKPTMSPIALPAPTVNPGMQIPKQKSKVSVSKKDDEDDKELERLKEMIRRS